jgi:hypothetical protein
LLLTTIVPPLPSTPPGARTSAVIAVIGCVRIALSLTGVRRGLAGEKLWKEKYMSAIVRYGWSPRTM